MAGLRVLNTTPLPREFDIAPRRFHFRSPEGSSELTLALEIPWPTWRPLRNRRKRSSGCNASLLILVKDSSGKDCRAAQRGLADGRTGCGPTSARPGRLTFGRPVTLAAGTLHRSDRVVDWQVR